MLFAAAEFCKELAAGSNPRWLSLIGHSGTGKTHLAKRIWQWFKENPKLNQSFVTESKEIIYAGQWVHWPKMVDALRAQEAWGRMEELRTEKFIVLDEVGSMRDTTGFASDQLANLLCCRSDKWTVITSNLTLRQIGEIDTRLSSRMIRGRSVCVECNGMDYSLRSTATVN